MNEEVMIERSKHIHEVADATINHNGYADDLDESDQRSQLRSELEDEILKLCKQFEEKLK